MIKLSDGAKALYQVFDKMGIDSPEMSDIEIVINTMEVVESNKQR